MTATGTAAGTPPRWDLDVLFPGPDSPEIRSAMQSVKSGAAELLEMLALAEPLAARQSLREAVASFLEAAEASGALKAGGTIVRSPSRPRPALSRSSP